MPRLLFEKRGEAVWISHLDLMRLFQRAFQRAELPLTHTHGFNPRPSVSIALPLSVGTESACELLDFDLEAPSISCDEICEKLNRNLIAGVKVLSVYHDGRKIRDIALMRSRLLLCYDDGISDNAPEEIGRLLAQDTLIVPKKTKNGMQDQDLIPMLRSVTIHRESGHTLCLEVLHCCQNPTLNPMQIPAAIKQYLPQYAPDFCKCARLEIYDRDEVLFR